MICPICAAALPEGARQCPGCGAELTDYLTAAYQPDLLYNEALDCLRRENWSEASALLCQAHALRPDDAEILALWVRSEFLGDNKKRAVELMTDLIELDDSPQRMEQFNQLVAEYDLDQSSGEAAVKRQLSAQSQRLSALLDRMERALDGAAPVPAGSTTSAASAVTGTPTASAPAAAALSAASTATAAPQKAQASKPSRNTKKSKKARRGKHRAQAPAAPATPTAPAAPAAQAAPAAPTAPTAPGATLPGGMPSFAAFSEMFPPSKP